MVQNGLKFGKIHPKMGQNKEICVPKWYTKIVMNFKAFPEVEVQVHNKKYKYKTASTSTRQVGPFV